MPDEIMAGQETPAPSEEPKQEAVPVEAATPESGTEPEQEKQDNTQAAKTFTQDELNDIVKRAKAATESKTERRVMRMLEQIQRQQSPQQTQAVDTGVPGRSENESEAQYLDRLVEWKLEQRTQQERMKGVVEKTDDFYAKAKELPGFDQEVFDSLPLTKAMAQTIADSDTDVGPRLMAYLSENPHEAERIAKLPASRQAAELGKLEAKATAQPKPTVQKPKAPAPINPVGAGKAPITDLSRMSAAEYYEQRMKQKPVWAR